MLELFKLFYSWRSLAFIIALCNGQSVNSNLSLKVKRQLGSHEPSEASLIAICIASIQDRPEQRDRGVAHLINEVSTAILIAEPGSCRRHDSQVYLRSSQPESSTLKAVLDHIQHVYAESTSGRCPSTNELTLECVIEPFGSIKS